MEKQPLISVIVPVYNVAAYLPRCLDSIVGQTYQNLEIILVDDGSTDHSGQICDQYAQKDKRIKVIHQQNQGLSGARNSGMDNMRGEFFTFVDGDDWLHPQYSSTLLEFEQRTKADLTIGDFWLAFDNGRLVKITSSSASIQPHLNLEEGLCFGFCGANHVAWGKLYKTQALGTLRFDTAFSISEDVPFFFQVLQRMNYAAYTPVCLYYYYQRSGSLIHQPNLEGRHKIFVLYKQIEHFCQTHQLTRGQVLIKQVLECYARSFLGLTIAYGEKKHQPYLRKLKKWVCTNKKSLLKNPNIKTTGKCFIFCFSLWPDWVIWGCRLPFVKKHIQKFVTLKNNIQPNNFYEH